MSNLRYLSIDPTPSLGVLGGCACAVAVLYCLEMWARRRARRRTREVIERCERQRNTST
jgi:hypothetical protein